MRDTPDYLLTIDGADITARLRDRLIDLTLTDKRGLEADQLDLTVSDHDGQVTLPERGVVIRCHIGWREHPLVDKGAFTVDEVEHSGSPDKLLIRARSADFRAGFKTRKERSWHDKTLDEIIATIAAEHRLEPVIAATLKEVFISHIDQTNESDANLLSRLAELHDAIAAVKNGALLMLPIGHAQTGSGLNLQPLTLTRREGDSHRYSEADRQSRYSGARAQWHDTSSAKTASVIAGCPDCLKTLPKTYASRAEAKSAAEAEWRRLQRGRQSMEITLAAGRADIIPELPVTLAGWKPPMDTINWLIAEIRHSVNDAGFTSQILLETALDTMNDS